MKWSIIMMLVALTGFTAAPAMAVLVPLSAELDGAQANAGAGSKSPGTGTASITLETDTNTLSWVISWSGLNGDPLAMHFHGPAMPNEIAALQIDTGVAGPPVVGTAVLTDDQENDVLAGLWYLNLHTEGYLAGEIRGTVVNNTVPTEASAWGQVKVLFR